MNPRAWTLLAASTLAACNAKVRGEDETAGPAERGGGAGGTGVGGAGVGGQSGARQAPDRDAGADAAVPGTPAPDGGPASVVAIRSPRVAISEIMYHPVLANADDNSHEFVEIHNPGAQPVAIGGWKLAGEIQYTFPAGTTIAPAQFLVVAKNRAKLLAVAKYNGSRRSFPIRRAMEIDDFVLSTKYVGP